MKPFRFHVRGKVPWGFSLVESVLSLGVLSFGFLALAPLLALGLTRAGAAHENRTAAQIASTLIEEAKQGTLAPGSVYFDSTGNPCASTQAAYTAQGTSTLVPGSLLTRLTLWVTPLGTPGSARIYADVFPTPPAP